MPIYEYRRPDGSTFEVMQSFSDDPLTHDPESGVEVQRVLHAPAVHFKGSGFYNTDYGTRRRQRESSSSDGGSEGKDGGSGAEKSGASDGAGSGKSESGTATKSESKTAAKAESGAKSAVAAS